MAAQDDEEAVAQGGVDSAGDTVHPDGTYDPPADSKGATGEESQAPAQPDESSVTIDKATDDEYTKQLQNQYQTDLKRSEAHAHVQKQSEDYFNSKIKELEDMKPPSILGQQQQMPPMAPQAKQHITQTIFQVLAIAATAFSVFGTRRNPGSQGAIMNGLGLMFQNIAKGRMEQAKEAQVQWHQHNEEIQKENRERLADYKDVLANKKLTLSQQMELFRMKADFYKDGRLEAEASQRDLDKIHKNLLDKQKQLDYHAKNTPKTTEDHKAWNELVKEKSGGKMDVDTPEGYEWALHNYPFSQYLNDKKTPRTEDPVTHRMKGGYSGAENGDNAKSPQSALDKAMDKDFGAIKPQGSPSPTPARTGSQKSVFDKSEFAAPGDNTEDDGSGL